MPCRDYEDDVNRTVEVPLQADKKRIKFLEKQNDKLARIACKALTQLEHLDTPADIWFDFKFFLAENKEVKKWWKKHKKADAEFGLEDTPK